MPKDARIFITITVDMPRSPKLAALTGAQKWLIVEALCHCREHKTDGVIDPRTWAKIARKRDRDAILETGVAVEFRDGEIVSGPPELRQNRATIVTQFETNTDRTLAPNCVLFLDYSEHQQLRREIEDVNEKRRSAGRKGGLSKAANAGKRASGNVASAKANAYQTPSKNVAEKEEEKDKELRYVPSAPLVSDARASEEAEIDAEISAALNKPGPVVPIDGHKLVRAVIPSSEPNAVRTALAIEANAMLHQAEPISPEDIRAGLELWLSKPELGPKTLPSLVSTINRQRNKPTNNGAYLPPDQRPLTKREQAHIDLELMKDNPNPAVLRQFGIDPVTRLKALPGAA